MAQGTFPKFIRLFVWGVGCLHALLLTVQNFDFAPLWASELSRFIPFYWLGLPFLVAAVLSCFVSLPLAAAALANILFFAWVTMDFHWQSPSDGTPGGRLRVLTYNIKALHAEL